MNYVKKKYTLVGFERTPIGMELNILSRTVGEIVSSVVLEKLYKKLYKEGTNYTLKLPELVRKINELTGGIVEDKKSVTGSSYISGKVIMYKVKINIKVEDVSLVDDFEIDEEDWKKLHGIDISERQKIWLKYFKKSRTTTKTKALP